MLQESPIAAAADKNGLVTITRVAAEAAALLLLLAPALWNGFPLLQYDTGGYIARWYEGTLEVSRSTVYGLFLNLLAYADFWPAVLVQAALTVWILSLLLFFTALLFGAAGEEAIFRGYAFQLLIDKLGAFATILPVGVLFGLAHGANPNATRLGLLNTGLWGVLLGCAFLRSHDLWLPIAMHYSWNAVLPIFGTDLSGITIEVTRYTYRWDLGPVWSGGAYGPEGGVLALLWGRSRTGFRHLMFVLGACRVSVVALAPAAQLGVPR